MTRRNWFASLFAPLIARVIPAPKRWYSLGDACRHKLSINEGLNPEWDGVVSASYEWIEDKLLERGSYARQWVSRKDTVG